MRVSQTFNHIIREDAQNAGSGNGLNPAATQKVVHAVHRPTQAMSDFSDG